MKRNHFAALGLTIISAFILNSCVKKSYETPPTLANYDPHLPVNQTIAGLVSPYLGASSFSRVLGDSIICGIVTADDRSGNFYKQIIIQDSSATATCPGAINISIDATYIYSDFPIGRKVYVKLKGLYLVFYKGNPELAFAPSATGAPTGIPMILEDTFIVAASYPHTVTPLEVRLSQLADPNPYLNMLLKIDNVEFDSASMGQPYAISADSAISTPRNIVGCDGTNGIAGSLELYNSGYATFYSLLEPSGYGSITGIFTIYSGTNQFAIRDTSDVQLTQPRCQ